ncbi:hypothetical protein [Cytobacillus sp.]|uniref:hypothetical protein n=1 Tax=Cytobacillus sp. TaxID=2675269 RepID=UPI0028BE839C|nr:hypothetical protein [Cytobacillus sp.]
MKKLFCLLMISILITMTSACGQGETGNNKSSDDISEKTGKENSEEQSIEVDKGLLNVEITLPASLFEDQDIHGVIADAKNEGIDDIKQNADGSLTFTMSKSKHKEMMKELESELLESIEDAKNNEDYVSIKDVTHNKSFSEFTLIVDQEKYENSFDGFVAFGFGLSGMYYQLFNGVSADDYKVTIIIKSEATGEVINTIAYPDALNESE